MDVEVELALPSLVSSEVVLGSLDNQLVVFEPQSPRGPPGIMTRARATLAMGKRLGLCYDFSEEVALRGIADNIRSRRLRGC